MKLKAITGIALTMLLLAVVSPIDVSVGVVDFDGESGDFVAQSGVDWWPMFRHDLNHTGYSTSTAPNTNNTIWTYTTGYPVFSSPAVAYGKVYVGSDGPKVYCLNATTGAHIWNYKTGGLYGLRSSPAVADGKVYVGSYDRKVYAFGSDTTPPNITDVSQFPFKNNVLPEDEVQVNATVTDDLSGVKQAALNYTNGNGTWINVDMTNLEGNVWNATIPKFPYCTNVTYAIIAEDNANNTITTGEMGYEYQYHVIPEWPSFIILSLFMLFTLFAVALAKKIRCKVAKTT